MPVTSIGAYTATPADVQANFHGAQLVYACWEHHLLFAAPFIMPVPPDMLFKDWVTEALTPLISADPDTPQIDWAKVQWHLGAQPWQPDFARSLKDNGVRHKAQIRMHTPGLNSLMPFAA